MDSRAHRQRFDIVILHCATPNKKTRPAFAKTGLHHALAVFVFYTRLSPAAPASCRSNRRSPHLTIPARRCQTRLSVQAIVRSPLGRVEVELVVLGVLFA